MPLPAAVGCVLVLPMGLHSRMLWKAVKLMSPTGVAGQDLSNQSAEYRLPCLMNAESATG